MMLAFGTHHKTTKKKEEGEAETEEDEEEKKKNWCRHQTHENERGSESVIRCYLYLEEIAE